MLLPAVPFPDILTTRVLKPVSLREQRAVISRVYMGLSTVGVAVLLGFASSFIPVTMISPPGQSASTTPRIGPPVAYSLFTIPSTCGVVSGLLQVMETVLCSVVFSPDEQPTSPNAAVPAIKAQATAFCPSPRTVSAIWCGVSLRSPWLPIVL